MIKMVFFDLDGTLLPMDQDVFTKAYFKGLVTKLLPHGYDPKALIDGIWAGTAAMVKNDGACTNEAAFWKCFAGIFGEKVREDEPVFQEFYEKEFQEAAACCGFAPEAKETVAAIKDMGLRLALATNPIFPAIATESRIRWAGLQPQDFELYTTYENSCYCKPNPDYYRWLLEKLDCKADECLMVGNDVEEDMIARTVGMDVFLLTDCMINKKDRDISEFHHGGFGGLLQYIKRVNE